MISIKVVLVSGDLRVRDEFDEKFFFLERDQTSSFGEVNTSDLSGNDSSDGSGMKISYVCLMGKSFRFRKSNTNRR